MNSPLVTIVTTVHDLQPYIDRCIRSVLAQTYSRWEQIIVDNGSTDGTQARIAQYDDPRIRYVRLPRRGIDELAVRYNTALALGSGELVAVLEGDDFWPPEKLSHQVAAFRDPEVQLTWGNATVVDSYDKEVRAWPSPPVRDPIRLDRLFRRLTCSNIVTPAVTVMVRRSALDLAGGFHQPAGILYVDLPTWLMVSALSRGKARRLDSLLGYYRVHPAQVSSEHYNEVHASQAAAVEAIVARCDPADLERVGWDHRQLAASRASGQLAAGILSLFAGNRQEARAMLRGTVRRVPFVRQKVRALLGLISTYLPLNLVVVADNLRRKTLSLRG